MTLHLRLDKFVLFIAGCHFNHVFLFDSELTFVFCQYSEKLNELDFILGSPIKIVEVANNAVSASSTQKL